MTKSPQVRHWTISDLHLGHERIYTFTGADGRRVRPEFQNAEDADRVMIARWNERVQPWDHVYCLGDVGWGQGLAEKIRALQGHKRLVLGNHDKEDVRDYRAMGFEKIFGCHRWHNGQLSAWLTHIPMALESLGGIVNIHGHIHEKEPYGPMYRNVSVERVGYAPVLIEDVIAGRYEVEQHHG